MEMEVIRVLLYLLFQYVSGRKEEKHEELGNVRCRGCD